MINVIVQQELNHFALFSLTRLIGRSFAKNSFLSFSLTLLFLFFSSPKVETARERKLFYFLARIGIRSRGDGGDREQDASFVWSDTRGTPKDSDTPPRVDYQTSDRFVISTDAFREICGDFSTPAIRAIRQHPRYSFSHFEREKYSLN